VTRFYRLSGAGNDFLALVEPGETPSAGEIRAWCRRGVSLGADGVFILSRLGGRVRMVHYNADGGRADLCLNGSRCAARLAFRLGWCDGDALTLETDAGVLSARSAGTARVEVDLPPLLGEVRPKVLAVAGRSFEGWTVQVGVPHFVLPWAESLARAPVHELGPSLRSHPDLGTDGANVDFVRFVEPDRFEIRTFERGVEGETLACGTGVVATAAAGIASGRLDLPVTALTSGGFELGVGGRVEDGRLTSASLAGDARILAEGEILPDASAVPSSRPWPSTLRPDPPEASDRSSADTHKKSPAEAGLGEDR
jgi:diaminopimelate epimerase